jgi:acetyl-CoA acetyltransferase
MSDCAIVGFGEHLEKEYKGSVFELFDRVASRALSMAGLQKSEIDGLISTTFWGTMEDPPFRLFFTDQIGHYLGLKTSFLETIDFGGPSFEAFVTRSCLALRSGLATNILCIGGGKASSLRNRPLPVNMYGRSWFSEIERLCPDFLPTSDYAMLAQRHAHEYGTTDYQRALLAVAQRKNALLNENALFKKALDVREVLGSPMICSPLHLLEIVPMVDGAHAFVISKTPRGTNRAVYVKGFGEAHDPSFLEERASILDLPIAASGKRAFEMAHMTPNRMDIAELYDSYTITTLLELENLGFCGIGKSGKFIEETDFSLTGTMPLNTNGGSLNVGQPAMMSGGVILAEAVRQLMGAAGSHQVKDARTAVVNGVGGNMTVQQSVTLILGTEG